MSGLYRRFTRRLVRVVYVALGRRPPVGRYLIELRRLESLAFEVAGALMLVCVAVVLWRTGAPVGREGWLTFALCLLDPARAAAALLMCFIFLPGLLGRRSLAWPAPVVIPALFVAWMLGIKQISEGPFVAVTLVGDVPRQDQMWRAYDVLGLVFLAQTALLWLAKGLRRLRT